MIRVKNLTFAYTKEYNALQNINFELANKSNMFILGEQESGRSSLLRILLGIENSFSGEVLYDNISVSRDIFKSTVDVGFLPEKMAFLENKSVYKNLEYVLKIRKVNKALQEIKINNAIQCFGLNGIKDTKMKDIGRFDRVKVALARLSLRKLDYIFVDDIFKEMPNSEIKYVMTELKKLIVSNEASAIIVSDNPEVGKLIKSKKYVLSYGILKEQD